MGWIYASKRSSASNAGPHLTLHNRWISLGSSYTLALLVGTDLILKSFLRLECRISYDTSELMVFLLESIYSPLSYWGGSKSRKAHTREHTDPDTQNALEPTDAPKSQKDLVPDLVPGPNKSAWPVSAPLS